MNVGVQCFQLVTGFECGKMSRLLKRYDLELIAEMRFSVTRLSFLSWHASCYEV